VWVAGKLRDPSLTRAVHERMKFKLAVIVYRAVHGTAFWCLPDLLRNVSDLPEVNFGRLLPDFLTSALQDYSHCRRPLIMAALRSRCGHYILPCSFFFLSFFFPRLTSAVGDWMSTILLHMVWP